MEQFKPQPYTIVCIVLLITLLSATTSAASDAIRHGVASAVAERRGVIATQDYDGSGLVIALIQDNYQGRPRNALLLIDPQTGDTEQYWYQIGDGYAGDTFALMQSKAGRFYTMFGGYFLEFDLEAREWSFSRNVGGLVMSFAEGPDGKIYAATYPQSTLIEFDPATRELIVHGRLDPEEMYPFSLAVDNEGWVYAGIGTANSNLVAYHPRTGELRQLAAAHERITGEGEVFRGVDGEVYGRTSDNAPWYRLSGGERKERGYAVPDNARGPIRWGAIVGTLPGGGYVSYFDTIERIMIIAGPGGMRAVRFNYESSGANITSLATGPDGRVYGSTSHPHRLFSIGPGESSPTEHGSIPGIGGGNVTNFTVQGEYLVGGAYNGGMLYKYNPSLPWAPTGVTNANPKHLVTARGPISRPRTVLAHPDGEHVIMAGFADYGYVGGGMLIYNLATDEWELLTHDKLLPGHSTITLRALPDGNLVGGTSVEAPGGGHPTETTARLYIFDWEERKIVFDFEPIPGVQAFGRTFAGPREIYSIEVDRNGLVYGITKDSQFFVFDPERRQVMHKESIAKYGSPVRPDQTFFKDENGDVYALMSSHIVRFDSETFAHQSVVVLPVPASAGVAYLDGRVYYANGGEVWSVALPRD